MEEGLTLYAYEKLNWYATDIYTAEATNKSAKAGIVMAKESGLSVIFYNDGDSCLYECALDTNSKVTKIDSVRLLTAEEKEFIAKRNKYMEAITNDTIFQPYINPKVGSINIDIIPQGENLTRVYVIFGVFTNNVIPFGNDYSFDFDKDDRLIASRKYHQSYIPTQWEDGKKVESTYHSHVENPYITPTDICTFLLYGHDLYGMDRFQVFSVKYKTTFSFSASKMKVDLMIGE